MPAPDLRLIVNENYIPSNEEPAEITIKDRARNLSVTVTALSCIAGAWWGISTGIGAVFSGSADNASDHLAQSLSKVSATIAEELNCKQINVPSSAEDGYILLKCTPDGT